MRLLGLNEFAMTWNHNEYFLEKLHAACDLEGLNDRGFEARVFAASPRNARDQARVVRRWRSSARHRGRSRGGSVRPFPQGSCPDHRASRWHLPPGRAIPEIGPSHGRAGRFLATRPYRLNPAGTEPQAGTLPRQRDRDRHIFQPPRRGWQSKGSWKAKPSYHPVIRLLRCVSKTDGPEDFLLVARRVCYSELGWSRGIRRKSR